jgi:hypothetical protein
VTPARIRAALEQDLRAMAGDIAATRRQVEELADTRALKAWLRSAMTAGRDLRALDALFRR